MARGRPGAGGKGTLGHGFSKCSAWQWSAGRAEGSVARVWAAIPAQLATSFLPERAWTRFAEKEEREGDVDDAILD